MSQQFFVRSPKNPAKVVGPVDLTKLKELVKQGKLKPSHEVSLDQKKWVSATKVKPSLFGDTPASAATAKSLPPVASFDSYDLESLVESPMTESAPTDFGSSAFTSDGVNLIAVKKYVPSGKCDKPSMLFAAVPIGFLVGVVAVPLVFAFAWGMMWLGLMGCLAAAQMENLVGRIARLFVSDAAKSPEEFFVVLNGWSLAFGAIAGGVLSGFTAAFFFEKWGVNRNPMLRFVAGALTVILLLTPALLLGSTIAGRLGLGSSYFWFDSPLLFVGCLAGAAFAFPSPFCENCRSFLKETHSSDYSARGDKLAELAIAGNVARLSKAKKLEGASDKAHTSVTLSTCDQKCCSLINMEFVPATDDDHEASEELESVRFQGKTIDLSFGYSFARGFLNAQQTATWKRLLDPIGKK